MRGVWRVVERSHDVTHFRNEGFIINGLVLFYKKLYDIFNIVMGFAFYLKGGNHAKKSPNVEIIRDYCAVDQFTGLRLHPTDDSGNSNIYADIYPDSFPHYY